MSGGHVFVIRGLLEHLDCDAVVVPSDENFVVEPVWDPVLGHGTGDDATHLRPERWTERRLGRAAGTGRQPPLPTWFIDAVWREGEEAEVAARDLAQRLAVVLGEIADAGIPAGHGRPHPVVAVPALGTGGGGFDRVRGGLIDLLLQACQDAVAETPLDVAVVAKQPADYSAFQEIRRRRSPAERQLSDGLQDAASSIAASAAAGQLALFLGAGVGVAAGLPSWRELLARLEQSTGISLEGLSPLDQAELLRRELGDDFGRQVAAEFDGAERYAVPHASLAALRCTEVVTTNYDALYELAARDVAGGDDVPVLPGSAVRPNEPWVLKMHGDVARPESIVLSRSDFVAYDARARPMASMVQALMMTRHLLVVGTSMTDDNFLRLAHEVAAFQDRGADPDGSPDPQSVIGTVVTLSPKPAQERLWRGRFRYVTTSDGGADGEAARRLAIFLDLVAMLAAGRDQFLLDPRYEQMLASDVERRVALAARELARAVGELPDESADAWRPLRDGLGRLGARPDR